MLNLKQNRREAELKARMAKFKRAKKKLISSVRSNRMFSLGLGMHSSGNTAFLSALAQPAGSKKANAVSAAKPVVPNFATQGGASGMNFAWPGENNDTKESKGTANDSTAKTQKMESSSGSGSESSSSSGAGSQSSDSEN